MKATVGVRLFSREPNPTVRGTFKSELQVGGMAASVSLVWC